MKNIVILFLVVSVIVIINVVPVRREILVVGECKQCMCMNVPTCGDVTLLKWGLPYTSYQRLPYYEYVDEPYRSANQPMYIAKNIFLNSLIGLGISGLIVVVLKKYKNI